MSSDPNQPEAGGDAAIGFCVVYRFHVRAGTERAFQEAWADMTRAIRAHRGGLGSRLHHADGPLWVAYAQWPDRATWERSSGLPSADPSASQRMGACLEGSLEPLLLEPTEDLLLPGPLAPRT